MWILKSHHQPIPNNYVFTQTTGILHTFPPSPLIDEVAKTVSAFRVANKLPRASLQESLQDVDQFQCAARNNNPIWCFECHAPYERHHQNHPFFRTGCPGCGVVITP